MHILLAEDEVTIARALKIMLERNKYTVDLVHNGRDALDYILAGHYDALILDIMMPEMDGIQVLTAVRRQHITTPALFLTAKGEVEDRIAGLDAGADDYLPKPFDSREFLARVRALVRRSDSYSMVDFSLGNTRLDCNSYVLGTEFSSVRLNNKEYQLMEHFFRYPHQVFSTEILLSHIWGTDSNAGIEVVWTYIGFLRKKLRDIHSDIELKTIRGAGYALEELKS